MKVEVYKPIEIEVYAVRIEVEVSDDVYEECPHNLFNDDRELDLLIEINTGKIISWQGNEAVNIFQKVRDEGVYTLVDNNLETVATLYQERVPNKLIPGEDGDYIDLRISADGVVTNWPKSPDVHDFFPSKDD